MPTDLIDKARQFAEALDADDYEAIRPLLSATCLYWLKGEQLAGPEAVIASYREHGESARVNFDGIAYSSSVTQATPRAAEVRFVDRILHDGREHVYQCRQRLTFDSAGRIEQIEHIELPGERERLEAFLIDVGMN